jgi:type I restriction enzyme, S subunit
MSDSIKNSDTEWRDCLLRDLVLSVDGGVSANCQDVSAVNGEHAVLKTSCVATGRFLAHENKVVVDEEKTRLKTHVTENTILFCRKNSESLVGASAFVEKTNTALFLPDLLWRITPNKDVDPRWLGYLVASPLVKNVVRERATGTHHSMKNIGQNALLTIKVGCPSLVEQRRIAEILTTCDTLIEKAEKLLLAKKSLFRAIASSIFERALASAKDVCAAKEILAPVSERSRPDLPLLAVMQDVGVVRRDEIDRRVTMPEGDGSTYKVARPGDFIISLRSFEGGLEYCDIEGLVSPAYTVLRPKVAINTKYYKHYFKSRSFVGRLDGLIFGIRDGKQIAFRDFGDMGLPVPRVEDQKRAADILDTAQRDCELTVQLIAQLERQKRGLMQKLLTGEWRVPVRDGEVGAMAARVTEEVAQ